MRRPLLASVLIFACSLGTLAQTTPPPQRAIRDEPEVAAALALVEQVIAGQVQEQKLAGLSAAVVYDRDILWSKGFGYADLEKKILADSQTVYRMASITKLFTATMLMQLRDAGKLQLDDPLQKYLPDFRITSRFDDSPPVTFREIASHTSGLPREPPHLERYWETLDFPPMETMLATLSETEVTFPPLTEWKYSNLGMGLMGYTLGRVAGEHYVDYVRDHILRPLGMNRSDFVVTPEMKQHMATGYKLTERGETEKEPLIFSTMGGLTPAGGLYSTVDDMARFISLQFQIGPGDGNQILRGSTIRELHNVQWVNPDWKSGYGIGFALSRAGERVAIGHEGDLPGFNSSILMVPDLKIGVAIFTNTRWLVPGPGGLAGRVLEVLIPVFAGVEARRQRAAEKPIPASWQKYVGRYHSTVIPIDLVVRIQRGQLILSWADVPALPPAQLSPEGEHKFRMKGGHSPGELLVFTVDSEGNITGLHEGNYYFQRVRDRQD